MIIILVYPHGNFPCRLDKLKFQIVLRLHMQGKYIVVMFTHKVAMFKHSESKVTVLSVLLAAIVPFGYMHRFFTLSIIMLPVVL